MGLVNGGQSINTVKANSSCSIDIRYENITDREDILEQVWLICAAIEFDGTSSSFEINGEFSHLDLSDKSPEIFEVYHAFAAKMMLKL